MSIIKAGENEVNMDKNYKKTLIACYLGFITQAIAANFAPLLFLIFHKDYGISLLLMKQFQKRSTDIR